MLLIAGIATLIISAWQYKKFVRYLWSDEFAPLAGVAKPMHTPLFSVTIVLIVVGIVALGAVILRMT